MKQLCKRNPSHRSGLLELNALGSDLVEDPFNGGMVEELTTQTASLVLGKLPWEAERALNSRGGDFQELEILTEGVGSKFRQHGVRDCGTLLVRDPGFVVDVQGQALPAGQARQTGFQKVAAVPTADSFESL